MRYRGVVPGSKRGASLLAVATCLPMFGCVALHNQVQYFAATDPETGATNYYRMTVTGGGGGLVNYHVQAGYFSAAAVDILRGGMPDVPELDLPVERLEVFDWLNTHFFAALIQEAKRLYMVFDPEALRTSALSALAYADQRLGELDADISRYNAELSLAQARKTLKYASRDREQSESDARKLALANAEAELAEAQTRGMGSTATGPAQGGTPPPAAVDLAPLLAKVADAAGKVAGTEVKLRAATNEADAADRAVTRASDKVNRATVEKARLEAARNVANETLAKLNASGEEGGPHGPLPEGQEAAPLDEAKIIELARMIWYGSLSSSDLASIGMTQNTSPYQFRKLVFWATAANIDLNEMAGEIDGILDNVGAVASAFRTQAKQKKAQEGGRRNAMNALLDKMELGPQGDLLRAALEINDPTPAESTGGLGAVLGGSR